MNEDDIEAERVDAATTVDEDDPDETVPEVDTDPYPIQPGDVA